jgi:aspartyl-tRNA(Asn)/glutamyl-tRNA(Gln) amidotransferase subunit A
MPIWKMFFVSAGLLFYLLITDKWLYANLEINILKSYYIYITIMVKESTSFSSINKLSEKIKNQELSSVDLVEVCIKRINKFNPCLNSFITVINERAYKDAEVIEKEIRRGVDRGPLQGIPFSIKDIISAEGVKCTAGSKIMSNYVSKIDSTVVERMRKAGAILLGTNNLNEFASGITGINPHYGSSKNPWNIHRISGGSSGGSAVAVATGMVPVSLGTDTGGSIRVPSSLCGVVGLKPTYGKVSKYGVMDLAPSLDHLGCITRSAWDAALVLEIIAGHSPLELLTKNQPIPSHKKVVTETKDKKLSVGIPKQYFFDYLQEEVKDIFSDVIDTSGLADSILEINLENTDKLLESWRSIRFAEATEIHMKWLTTRPNDYSDDVRKMLIEGNNISAIDYIRAHRVRTEMRREFLKLLKKVDVIVVPTTILTAPRFDDLESIYINGKSLEVREALLRNTILFNSIGLPAISIPVGLTKDQMPVGVQIVGSLFEEEKILSMAYKYECINNSLTKFVPSLN